MSSPERAHNRTHLLLLVLACTLGAFLRLLELNSLPLGLWYDEAINGLDALDVITKKHVPLFFTTEQHPREPLFIYLNVLTFSLTGARFETLRLTNALIGIATLPALFLLVREVANQRTALIATFLLAALRWHVHFSRLNLRTILVPFLAILTIYLLIRALKTHRLLFFCLTGLLLGLGFYSYLSFRIFALLVPFLLFLHSRKSSTPLSLNHIILMFLIAGIVVAPLTIDYILHPSHLTGRMQEVSLFKEGPFQGIKNVLNNTLLVTLMFTFRGDPEPKHNPPFLPVLDPVFSLLFFLGLFLLLRKVGSDPFALLMLLWFLLLLLPSIFSFGAPNMLRTLGAVPPFVFLLALALDFVHQKMAQKLSRSSARLVLILLLLYFTAIEAHRYFNLWSKDPLTWQRMNGRETQIALWARDLTHPNTRVFLPPVIAHHPSFRFINPPRGHVYPLSLPDALVYSSAQDHAILLTNYSDPRLAYLIMQLYSPPATYLTSPWEEPIGYVYLLSSHRLLTPEQLQQALQPFPFALQELNTQL